MANYLIFDGTDDYVDISGLIPQISSDIFHLKVVLRKTTSANLNNGVLFRLAPSTGRGLYMDQNDFNWYWKYGEISTAAWSWNTPPSDGVDKTLYFVVDQSSGTIQCTEDDTYDLGTITSSSGTLTAYTSSDVYLGCRAAGTNHINALIREFSFIDPSNSANNRKWTADDSDTSNTGAQPILTETLNGDDGTGINFPTDGSAWYVESSGGYTLEISGATFSYTGGALDLVFDRSLTPVGGVYSYSGGDVGLSYARVLDISGGNYSYSGSDLTLGYDRTMLIEGGIFTYSAAAIDLTYNQIGGYVLEIEGGVFSYSGGEAALAYDRVMDVAGGSFVYAGSDVSLSYDRTMAITGADYSYSGSDIGLIYNRVLTISGGVFYYSGANISLDYSAAEIRLISGYTVNYKSISVSASYGDDQISISYKEI